jgi:rifampicin phosphotransferase
MTSQTQAGAFPVEWRSAEEEGSTWARDAMHFPAAVTVITGSFLEGPFNQGVAAAFEELSMPVTGFVNRIFSSHVYMTVPPVMLPPEAMEERMGRNHRLMGERMERLRDIWENEYRPACEDIAARMRALDFADPSADLEALVDLFREATRIHFLLVIPRLASGERFAGIYAQVTGSSDEMEPYRCLMGEPNKSLECDRALWSLAERARASEVVSAALGRDGSDALAALEGSEEGRGWCAAFDEALAEYGQRGQAIDFSSPTWIEEPTFALENVRRYLGAEALDPEGARAAHLAERERLVGEARARIGDEGLRAAFDGALEAARRAWPLEEDHAFYIDQRIWGAATRGALLRLGGRLVELGRLDDPGDVMHLDLAELRAAAAGADGRDPARAGRRRQADDSLLDPPPLLGAPPDPAHPMDPGMVKFFGAPGPPEVDGAVLRGAAGSRGSAEGVARVVASVDGLGEVLPGEVLVCRSTTPPWTPVFASIAALVTDTGGVLAHGAIVAREYGIPAVMGTKIGTRMIRTGQRVVVDGDAGEVRIVG